MQLNDLLIPFFSQIQPEKKTGINNVFDAFFDYNNFCLCHQQIVSGIGNSNSGRIIDNWTLDIARATYLRTPSKLLRTHTKLFRSGRSSSQPSRASQQHADAE